MKQHIPAIDEQISPHAQPGNLKGQELLMAEHDLPCILSSSGKFQD
jgi:hypothetical protein